MAEQQTDSDSVLATHTADPTQLDVSHPPKSYTYYHAGPLFTIAELHTNTLLSQSINRLSSGKFIPILPQDLEQRDLSPQSIRDEDLRALISCDLAMFTYDGAELDAGTVVEYMFAKMADIPTVILRTDFRGAGDQAGAGDPWNLMSSNWPRTASVTVNSMMSYKASLQRAMSEREGQRAGGQEIRMVGESMIEEVAQKVVDGFERVLKEKPRLPKELRGSVYQWLALMPGFKMEEDSENFEAFSKLCADKAAKGLL